MRAGRLGCWRAERLGRLSCARLRCRETGQVRRLGSPSKRIPSIGEFSSGVSDRGPISRQQTSLCVSFRVSLSTPAPVAGGPGVWSLSAGRGSHTYVCHLLRLRRACASHPGPSLPTAEAFDDGRDGLQRLCEPASRLGRSSGLLGSFRDVSAARPASRRIRSYSPSQSPVDSPFDEKSDMHNLAGARPVCMAGEELEPQFA